MSTHEPDEPVDPEPRQTPGLDSGGSVPPGETPPEPPSATQGLSHPQPAEPRATKWGWLTGITIIVVLVALFFVVMALMLAT